MAIDPKKKQASGRAINRIPTRKQAAPPQAADLFDTLKSWLSTPDVAFSSWLAARQLGSGSSKVYLVMWKKYLQEIGKRGWSLDKVDAGQIQQVMDEAGIKKGYRNRLLRLVERAYDHMILKGLPIANPARRLVLTGDGRRFDADPEWLTEAEAADVERIIAETLAMPEATERGKTRKRKAKEEPWLQVRDAALVAVLLGAGVKVAEVSRLTVNCTKEDALRIPGIRPAPDHYAHVYPFARRALKVWSSWRRHVDLQVVPLFPADINRRQRADLKVATAAMHPVSVFRRTRVVLERAGITGARACPQTLRNTYAARLFKAGASDEKVLECLGLADLLSVIRLRNAFEGKK